MVLGFGKFLMLGTKLFCTLVLVKVFENLNKSFVKSQLVFSVTKSSGFMNFAKMSSCGSIGLTVLACVGKIIERRQEPCHVEWECHFLKSSI